MQENKITYYVHCNKCYEELPEGVPPKEFSKIEVGITKENTILVRCIRHDLDLGEFEIAKQLTNVCPVTITKKKESN